MRNLKFNMGFVIKSLMIVFVALATPIIYRQIANEGTIKFMSSYYSNYKSIDQLLRQSASHLDQAIEYIALKQQEIIDSLTKSKIELNKKEKESLKSSPRNEQNSKEQQNQNEKKRMTSCPGEDTKTRLWTKEELSKFDGSKANEKIYLGFLGLVYDVSANPQHYGSDAEYNVFAGRDATRAFVTGNFTHDLHDDIRNIETSLYSHIESWVSFYQSTYPVIGRLIGQYYDSNGCATNELNRINEQLQTIQDSNVYHQEKERTLPECNSEWNGELKKGRVWCSNKSGGVEREWAGFPRIYEDGDSSRCACYNPESPNANELNQFLKPYPDCDPNASECSISSL